MVKIRRNTSQRKLLEKAIAEVNRVFSEEDRHYELYFRTPQNSVCFADKRYFYFSGPLYIKDGFVDANMIRDLQDSANILSVGSGEGHLERLLHLGFDIPKNRIHVSDLEVHPKLRDFGFSSHVFDMTKKWPKFSVKFDYVIFPESMSIATDDPQKDEVPHRFFGEVKDITALAMQGKINDISQNQADFFIDLLEQDIPVLKLRYQILNSALDALAEKGQVRISHGFCPDLQKAYVKLKFQKEGINASYQETKYPHQFFIRKE